jgi:hypothetical protein
MADRNLIATFKPATLFEFWAQLRSEYPEVAKHAVKKLLPFASTYRCEVAFSKYTLTNNKTKQRSRLDPEADMRLQLSNIKLHFKELISGRQAHQSHKKKYFSVIMLCNFFHVMDMRQINAGISFYF